MYTTPGALETCTAYPRQNANYSKNAIYFSQGQIIHIPRTPHRGGTVLQPDVCLHETCVFHAREIKGVVTDVSGYDGQEG